MSRYFSSRIQKRFVLFMFVLTLIVFSIYTGVTWYKDSTPGDYEVYAWWASARSGGTYDRDSAASYTIATTAGNMNVTRDQNAMAGDWVLLGTYGLNGGASVTVTSSGDGTNGTSADELAVA